VSAVLVQGDDDLMHTRIDAHSPDSAGYLSSQTAPAAPSLAGLIGWVGLCVGGGALVGLWASADTPWYAALSKPSWQPPSWVFAPVWTALYAAMGVAAWLVWRRGGWRRHPVSLPLFLVQLAVNFAWSPLFFVARWPEAAAVDIAILWLLVAVTLVRFRRTSVTASWLMAPYLAWVSFAAALNGWIARYN
jgi:benzodiazapine receptor